MNEHSKIPWFVRSTGTELLIVDNVEIGGGSEGRHTTVARVNRRPIGHVAEANAARIVAAVNGTDGIPDAALERGVVAEMVDAFRELHDARQRPDASLVSDEMFAAFRRVADLVGRFEGWGLPHAKLRPPVPTPRRIGPEETRTMDAIEAAAES